MERGRGGGGGRRVLLLKKKRRKRKKKLLVTLWKSAETKIQRKVDHRFYCLTQRDAGCVPAGAAAADTAVLKLWIKVRILIPNPPKYLDTTTETILWQNLKDQETLTAH